MRVLWIFCALIWTTTPSFSAEKPQPFSWGAGNSPCSMWTEARKNESAWHEPSQWILGFVSASNVLDAISTYNLKPVEMFQWVDGFCRKHPDQYLKTAVLSLILENRVF